MTMTTDRTPALYAVPGDLIQTYKGQLFRVTRVKQVNYGVVDEDGKNWNLRKTGAFLAPAGAVFSGPAASETRPKVTEVPLPSGDVRQGSLVRIVSGKYAGDRLLVVIRDNKGSYSLAKLGGDPSGQYYRGFRENQLEVVDPSRITVS